MKGTLSEVLTKVAGFEKNLVENNALLTSFGKHVDSIRSMKFKIENFELQLRTDENYLEKYLPLYTQAQISETLHNCLSTNNRRKLVFYEEKKFREMNNDILHDDGNPNIQRRVDKAFEILEPTIKRYTRMLIAQNLGVKPRESITSSRLDKTDRKTENSGTQRKLESERDSKQTSNRISV